MSLFINWLQKDLAYDHQIIPTGLTLHCPYRIVLLKNIIDVQIKGKVIKQENGCWTIVTFENYNTNLIEDFNFC